MLGSEVTEELNLIRCLDQRRRGEEQAEATVRRSKVSTGSKVKMRSSASRPCLAAPPDINVMSNESRNLQITVYR